MRLLIVLLATLLPVYSVAQKQNNNWCFGNKAGVNFNQTLPSNFTSNMDIEEDCATISDRVSGELLFYTDGVHVFDKTHNIMPNGNNIGKDSLFTSSQGSVIVPFINDPYKYYLFTVEDINRDGVLRYSVVDMKLHNGLGDVIPIQKAQILGSGYTEGMTVAYACDKAWLILLKRNKNSFDAYQIMPGGLDSHPVMSNVSYAPSSKGASVLKLAPNSKKLAVATYTGNNGLSSYLALHDFDIATGLLTNGIVIDSVGVYTFYGCEFSPDSKKLFTTDYPNFTIYQYDISLASATNISASKTKVFQHPGFVLGSLQLGPDSNIYVPTSKKTKYSFLDRISNPNVMSPGCIYTPKAISLGLNSSGLTLPQLVAFGIFNQTSRDSNLLKCSDSKITIDVPSNRDFYLWSDGSMAPTMQVENSGVYVLQSRKGCTFYNDTFNVIYANVGLNIGKDTAICFGDSVRVTSNINFSGTTYLWNNGDTSNAIIIKTPGIYYLTVTYKGCKTSDEIHIERQMPPGINLGDDRSICHGTLVTLPILPADSTTNSFLWSNGSTRSSIVVEQSGIFSVTIANACGSFTDKVKLDFHYCNLWFTGAFSPNGDGLNDIAHLMGDIDYVSGFKLNIFNRYGQCVYDGTDPYHGWDGKYGNAEQPMGTYYYLIRFKYLGDDQMMKGDVTLLR